MELRFSAIAFVTLMFSLIASLGSAWAIDAKREPKRVLLVHSSAGANFLYAMSIRDELNRQSQQPVEVYDASIMTGSPDDELVADRYGDYLRVRFPNQLLDLVVAVGGTSVRLLERYRAALFPTTPILVIAEQRRLASNLITDATTVAASIDFAGVIENILHVLPQTTNVAVIIGNSSVEQYWREQMRATFEPFASRVSFTWLNDLPVEDMLPRTALLPPNTAIVFTLMRTDAAGLAREENKVFSMVQAVANAPIFSYFDGYFGEGIVGGPLISVQEKSRTAVAAALRILGGEAPETIKIPPVGFSTPKFDWRQMQRWGISEARLPPGSEIQFRPMMAWEQYGLQILVGLATIMLQAGLIAWLIYEHHRRHSAELIARNSIAELTHMNRFAAVGELSASIAHEVNQPLTGIATRAAAALRWLGADVPDLEKARAALTQIVSASHRTSDIVYGVRDMFRKDPAEKQPVYINKIIGSVLSIIRTQLHESRIKLRLQLNSELPALEGNKIQLQQVVINLVMNAIESMQSMQEPILHIRSDFGKFGSIRVSITDNGRGIDQGNLDRIFKPLFTTKERGMGMGLSVCKSIVERHNGRIWLRSGAQAGVTFEIEFPSLQGACPKMC